MRSIQDSISFGSFSAPIAPSDRTVFGNTALLNVDRVLREEQQQRPSAMQWQNKNHAKPSLSLQSGSQAQVSNFKSAVNGLDCTCCLRPGHVARKCLGKICCWKCSYFGHKKGLCSTRSGPIWFWQQKSAVNMEGNQVPSGPHVQPSLMGKEKHQYSSATPDSSPHNAQHPIHQPAAQGQAAGGQNDEAMIEDVNEEDEDEWPAWNPVVPADVGQQLPQHPAVPQYHLDLELSGSSIPRGDGPNISLDQMAENVLEDGSSSSSDATSVDVEEQARFLAACARCANVLLLGRKDILTDVFTRASDRLAITEPIIVDRNAVQAALPHALVANHGLEIVPWKPVNDAIPLQMWTIFLESRRAAKPASTALMLTQGGPTDPSPPQFESGLEQNKPSPPSVRGRKGRRTAVKKKLALPTTVSLSSSSTPPVPVKCAS